MEEARSAEAEVGGAAAAARRERLRRILRLDQTVELIVKLNVTTYTLAGNRLCSITFSRKGCCQSPMSRYRCTEPAACPTSARLSDRRDPAGGCRDTLDARLSE